jgi:hypothetical protein
VCSVINYREFTELSHFIGGICDFVNYNHPGPHGSTDIGQPDRSAIVDYFHCG